MKLKDLVASGKQVDRAAPHTHTHTKIALYSRLLALPPANFGHESHFNTTSYKQLTLVG